MSAPASSQRRIWSIVALASAVDVLVMVCTVTGASPPTGTLPTMICRDLRRTMSRQGLTDMARSHSRSEHRGFDEQEKAQPAACQAIGARRRLAARRGAPSVRGRALGE